MDTTTKKTNNLHWCTAATPWISHWLHELETMLDTIVAGDFDPDESRAQRAARLRRARLRKHWPYMQVPSSVDEAVAWEVPEV